MIYTTCVFLETLKKIEKACSIGKCFYQLSCVCDLCIETYLLGIVSKNAQGYLNGICKFNKLEHSPTGSSVLR